MYLLRIKMPTPPNGDTNEERFEAQKRATNIFGPCWFLFSPGDPENWIRGAILSIFVAGELRGMTFKLFYAKLRKNLLSLLLLAPTINV